MKKAMAIISDTSDIGGTMASKRDIHVALDRALEGTGIKTECNWSNDSSHIKIGHVLVCCLVGDTVGLSDRSPEDFESIRHEMQSVYSFEKDILRTRFITPTFITAWVIRDYNPNHTESYSVF